MPTDAEVLTVGVNQLKDYEVCSLFYNYKYREHTPFIEDKRDLMNLRFEEVMKRTASYYFYKRQGGVIPSYNSILNRWEKLWFPKGTSAYDLKIEQHESVHGSLVSYTKIAAHSFMEFNEDFSNNDYGIPLLIDEKFLIPLGSNVRLEGSIDLVLRDREHFYRVIKWVAHQKRPSLSSLMLDFAAQKLAFEFRNETPKRVSYYIYDLGSPHTVALEMFPNKNDINALKFWAKSIRDEKVFYPRRGMTTRCRGCPYDKPCSNFEFPQVF